MVSEPRDGSSGALGGTKSWRRGPNLPPFSSFSTDLGHFILKSLNLDIYFLFYVKFLSLFSRFGVGKQAILGLWGGGGMAPWPPWIRLCQSLWDGPWTPLDPHMLPAYTLHGWCLSVYNTVAYTLYSPGVCHPTQPGVCLSANRACGVSVSIETVWVLSSGAIWCRHVRPVSSSQTSARLPPEKELRLRSRPNDVIT